MKPPDDMIHIPAGEFVMGSPRGEVSQPAAQGGRGTGPGRGSRNDTRRTVRLSEFHIGKNLVTNAEYKLFCDAAGSRYKPGGNRRDGVASYWDSPEFNWAEKDSHPVLFVGYNQVRKRSGNGQRAGRRRPVKNSNIRGEMRRAPRTIRID